MIRLWKKFGQRPGAEVAPWPVEQDVETSSPADLRRLISELENEIAEHEATNEFLRDLLTERWFEAERPLARL